MSQLYIHNQPEIHALDKELQEAQRDAGRAEQVIIEEAKRQLDELATRSQKG